MVPIFEQGKGRGIGHTFNTFIARFIEICEEHLDNGRAKAFAFILYDFHDEATRQILHDLGGFTRLDRLSSNDLSVFYLHSANRKQLKAFNDIFLHVFDIPTNRSLPFVLFFRVVDRDAKDVEIIELDQSNLIFAFDELYGVIKDYIEKLNNKTVFKDDKSKKFIRLFRSVKKIAGEKFIEYLISKSGEYAGKHLL